MTKETRLLEKTARTVNRKISSLKTYFKYLMREGYITVNPVSKVLTPKIEQKACLFLFVKKPWIICWMTFNMETIMKDSETVPYLETFYNTGIRISELIHLKFRDIDFAQQVFKVLGKRNKERMVPLSQNFAASFCSNLRRFAEANFWVVIQNGCFL